jgi:cytosolic iron-sulfur protein assembly protein CIAO1
MQLCITTFTNMTETTTLLRCVQRIPPPIQRISLGNNTAAVHDTVPSGSDDQYHSLTFEYTPRQTAWQCTFDKDGTFLAVAYGAPDPCVRIWYANHKGHRNMRTSEVGNENYEANQQSPQQELWILHATLRGIHERTIRAISFAPITHPHILACASFDGTVTLWEHDTRTSSIAHVENDDLWECAAQLEGHENEVKTLAWNSTGSLLATGGRDKTVWLWECFLPGAVLHGHEGDVKCVRFAPNHTHKCTADGDEILLSASYDESIRLWAEDAGEWYCAMTFPNVHASTIWSMAISPSGGRLISSSADSSLAIYKAYPEQRKGNNEKGDRNGTWECVGQLKNLHPTSVIFCVDYAPARVGHGCIVTGGSDHRIIIYREVPESLSDQPKFSIVISIGPPPMVVHEHGREINHAQAIASQRHHSVFTHDGDVNCVCWHPWDGSMLASTGDDGCVCIWEYIT